MFVHVNGLKFIKISALSVRIGKVVILGYFFPFWILDPVLRVTRIMRIRANDDSDPPHLYGHTEVDSCTDKLDPIIIQLGGGGGGGIKK